MCLVLFNFVFTSKTIFWLNSDYKVLDILFSYYLLSAVIFETSYYKNEWNFKLL